jgi:hypothetical protein
LLPLGRTATKRDFVLWGDSHALALLPGVDTVASECGRAGWFINLKHNFTLKPDIGPESYHPRQDREPVFKWLEDTPEIQDVFLVTSWFFQLRSEEDVDEAIRVCERLKSCGKHAFVFLTVPAVNNRALYCYDWGLEVGDQLNSTGAAAYDARARRQEAVAKQIRERSLGKVIPLNRAMWNGTSYYAGSRSESYYADKNHLNSRGAVHAMRHVAPLIWGDGTAGGPEAAAPAGSVTIHGSVTRGNVESWEK